MSMPDDPANRIHELDAPFDGPRIVGACSNGRVAVCDLRTRKCVATFSTIFGSGGRRIAIHPGGHVCAAASYKQGAVAIYNADSGQLLNLKKGMKHAQTVSYSPDGALLYGTGDGFSTVALDSESLEEVARYPHLKDVYCSPYEELDAMGRGGERGSIEIRRRGGEKISSARRTTFGILSIAFAPGRLCVSESGGPVRCLEVETGREVWRHDPEPNSHFLSLAYSPSLSAYFGIWWNYRFGSPRLLVRFDPETGDAHEVARSDPGWISPVFCDRSSILVSAEGDIVDLATGKHDPVTRLFTRDD